MTDPRFDKLEEGVLYKVDLHIYPKGIDYKSKSSLTDCFDKIAEGKPYVVLTEGDDDGIYYATDKKHQIAGRKLVDSFTDNFGTAAAFKKAYPDWNEESGRFLKKEEGHLRIVHGSGDSIDKDVIYVFEELPDRETCKKFCSSDETENRNIVVIKNGEVVACYKGTPDECNNAILETFHLHPENKGKCPVTHKVERIIPLKAIRAVRTILSYLSRSQYRPIIKAALKSNDWKERLAAIRTIDYSTIDYYNLNKDMTAEGALKKIAFQIGQVLCLLKSKGELYTKKDISLVYPVLAPYLARNEYSVTLAPNLNTIIGYMVDELEKLDVSMYNLIKEEAE